MGSPYGRMVCHSDLLLNPGHQGIGVERRAHTVDLLGLGWVIFPNLLT